MIIFLTGMMGSGKTEVGKALARELNYDFLDLDHYLEEKTGKTIPDIFREQGEAAFRDIEKEMKLDPVMKTPNLVVATGGGFPLDSSNRDWMASKGLVFWLQTEPETILKRLSNSDDRPLLPQPVQVSHIQNILSKRTFVYKKANYYIQTDGKSVDEIVREILKRIKNA
jgi:shikimate kinase